MSVSSDIPGYYYDSKLNKYFKIENQGTPGFVTHDLVNNLRGLSASRKVYQLISDHLKATLKKKNVNILNVLNGREFSKLTSSNASYCISNYQISRLKCQHTQPCGHVSKLLVSPTTNRIFVISNGCLEVYKLLWSKNKSQENYCAKYGACCFQFRLLKSVTFPTDVRASYCTDINWRNPDHSLAYIIHNDSGFTLTSLLYDHHNFKIQSKTRIPHATGPIYFVSPLRTSSNNVLEVDIDLNSRPAIMFGRKNIYISNYKNWCRVEAIPRFSNGGFYDSTFLSACCEASPWISCDLLNKSIKSVPGMHPLLYVAGTRSSECFLSLVQPALHPYRCKNLITFDTDKRVNFSNPQSVAPLEITNLQCLMNASRDRVGLIVERRCGLIQLWDDRFPKIPAVEFYGSNGQSLVLSASHIPPKAMLDPVQMKTIACPLIASSSIGIWDITTGELLNMCDLSNSVSRTTSARPPTICYQTAWCNMQGELIPHAALISFDIDQLDVFCA